MRCVDDTAGPSAEYTSIQAAVDATTPGDTVLVFAGAYGGFRVTTSGTASGRIEIRAEGGVTLTGPEAETHNFIRIQNASFITIEGFHLVGSGQPQPYDYDYACLAARGAKLEVVAAECRATQCRIDVAAGAGGHAGALSPFGLLQETREWFDGPIALSGAIARGQSILAAQAMGVNIARRRLDRKSVV